MKIIFMVVILTLVYLFGMIQLEHYRLNLLQSLPQSSIQHVSSLGSSSSLSQVLIEVQIDGAIESPQTISIVPGTTYGELLTLVGGTLASADLRAIELSYVIEADESLYVPSKGDVTKVSLNTGSTGDLDSLPGIGYVMATRIIEYRTTHGPFMTIEQLMNVSGIGPATFEALRDVVIL